MLMSEPDSKIWMQY